MTTSSPIQPVPSDTAEAYQRARSGRNLPAALAVGFSLGGLVLLSLLVQKAAFVALACVAIVLATWELANALATRDIHLPLVPVTVGGVVMLISAYAGGAGPLAIVLALTSIAVLLWRLPDGPYGYLRDAAAGIFAVVYGPFLAGAAMLMLRADDGPLRVVVFVIVVVCSDVGGFAVGVVAGRHPMAPTVSPKKSWEGFAGSLLACCVGGALSVHYLLYGAWWQGVVVGLAVVGTATLGDLSESMIKRDLGLKDMGSLLPGHGGVFDRLDSLLPSAPAVYVLLTIFVSTAPA